MEVVRLFESLAVQPYRDFEAIVVDQNPDRRVESLIPNFRGRVQITHLRSAPGLSKARNLGLTVATGAVVAFPDDDCWYHQDLLPSVADMFARHADWHGVSGVTRDATGVHSVVRWDRERGLVDRINVWRRCTSTSLFLRREVITAVGGFDEMLGAGSPGPWQSAEDIDCALKCVEHGYRIRYDPDVWVGHGNPVPTYDARSRSRALIYAAGAGRVIRLHHYPAWFVGYQLIRPLGGVLLSLVMGRLQKARYHFAILVGRIRGVLSVRTSPTAA